MRLLLDSHIVINVAVERLETSFPGIARVLSSAEAELWVSAASLWEIAIKVRLGKLEIGTEIEKLPLLLRRGAISLLAVDERHALTAVDPAPPTKDPFDRMLLAQCQVEGFRLVTVDRALVGHPLAWRPD
jgi:PIN domain nuclease of toxin-antitoxin system